MKKQSEVKDILSNGSKEGTLNQLKRVALLMFQQTMAIGEHPKEEIQEMLEKAIDNGNSLHDLIDMFSLFKEDSSAIRHMIQTLVLQAMIEDPSCDLNQATVLSHFKEQNLMTYEVALLYGYHELLPDLAQEGCHERCEERLARAGYPDQKTIIKAWQTGQGKDLLSVYGAIGTLMKQKLGTPDEIKTVIQFEPDPEKFLRQCKDLEKRGLTKLDVSILNNKQKLAFALASLIDELNGETLSHMLSESRKRLMAVGFMVDAEDIETALEPYIKKTDKDILSHTETLEQNILKSLEQKVSESEKMSSSGSKTIPEFAKTGMGYLSMKGDGNCQFHTCLKGIQIVFQDFPTHPIHTMSHLDLRRAVADYMDIHWFEPEKNWGTFIAIHFEECIHQNAMTGFPHKLTSYLNYFAYAYRFAAFMDPNDEFGLKTQVQHEIDTFLSEDNHHALVQLYTEALREPKTWGNDLELAAISAMFGVQFIKHQVNGYRQPVAQPFAMGGSGPEINLAYNGGHYDLLLTPLQALASGYQIGFSGRDSSMDLSFLVKSQQEKMTKEEVLKEKLETFSSTISVSNPVLEKKEVKDSVECETKNQSSVELEKPKVSVESKQPSTLISIEPMDIDKSTSADCFNFQATTHPLLGHSGSSILTGFDWKKKSGGDLLKSVSSPTENLMKSAHSEMQRLYFEIRGIVGLKEHEAQEKAIQTLPVNLQDTVQVLVISARYDSELKGSKLDDAINQVLEDYQIAMMTSESYKM